MNTILETHNITKNYGDYAAVNNVSISLNQGDIYGLIGKNGAGKSTLFKLMMGLMGPNEGHLELVGKKDTIETVNARKNIGFMVGSNFFAYMNAYDNLNYYRKLKGISDEQEIDRVLKIVELDGVKKKFKAYSLGMKQRLGIANALLGNPEIVVLDEPVNGLDPQGISDFRKLIQRLNREQGITFLVSSHILGELGMMATRFGFIDKGVLIEEISREALHLKTRSSLKIEVNDTAKASVILEEIAKTKNYRIINQRFIHLEDFIDKPHEISRMLIENGVDLHQIVIDETSLEDYFLNLVGGNENA